MSERNVLLTSFRKRFNEIFTFATGFFVGRPKHTAIKAYLLMPYYILASKLEADVSLIES